VVLKATDSRRVLRDHVAGGRTRACGRCFKAGGTGATADELPARKNRSGGQRSAGL
jgi:hypothetical protein